MPKDITRFGEVVNQATADGRAKIAELKAAAIRLRNFGAPMSTIADKLGLSEADAETVLMDGLRETVADDADMVRARQQAVLNDIKRAAYPGMANGDEKMMGMLVRVLDHEAKIHPGVIAPQRVRVGLDQEAFTTTVDEDIRALGLHPRMDVPLEEGDDGWANT